MAPARRVTLVLVTLLCAGACQSGSSGDSSSDKYSGAELAASIKARQPANRGPVTVTCEDAPRRAGAISDCTLDDHGLITKLRVTYDDDQGHFTVQTR